MKKRILAFGASNSRHSINKQLATWSASLLSEYEIDLIDLNDFEMPLFSVDLEQESGIPEKAYTFKELIRNCSGILISFAEHNGSYSVAYKNVTDWASRIEKEMWCNKPVLLLATSPGKRGGQGVLAHAIASFPHRAAKVAASFSLPSFKTNFDPKDGILDLDLRQSLLEKLESFKEAIED